MVLGARFGMAYSLLLSRFGIEPILFKLADKEEMYSILNEFKF